MAAAGTQQAGNCTLVKVGELVTKGRRDPLYTGLVVLPENRLLLVNSQTKSIRLHERSTGQLIAESDRSLSYSRDICLLDESGSQVAATLDDGEISILSVQCTEQTAAINTVRIIKTKLEECYAVSGITSSSKLVVSGRSMEMRCWYVMSIISNEEGNIHKICPEEELDQSYLTISNDQLNVYISCLAGLNSIHNAVYGYNLESGNRIFVHKMTRPRGICVDKMGFIYICNEFPDFAIHQLNKDGELVLVFKEGIPNGPRAACFDENQELYITSWRRRKISRFRIEWHDKGVLPPEILNMDESFQKLYKEALGTGKDKIYNIRVMIVGHQGMGKTSLTQRLLGAQVKENETESTEGIEVHTRCCQIDHASRKWKRKDKTDELFLNDQRIASILHKYTITHNNQDIKDTVPVNGISPTKKQRLSQDDGPPVPSPSGKEKENIPNYGTVNRISENASDNTKSDVENLQRDEIAQTEKRTDETERRTYPEEIQNFVERAQFVPIPRSMSSDVTLLDFAGQSLFYTTHQAFMSWRTLYLLVTDMSLPLTDAVEDGAYGIDESGKRANIIQAYVTFWLNSIHSHVPIPEDDMMRKEEKKTRGEESSGSSQGATRNHPFVILVGTHTDKIPKDLLEERKKTYFNDIRIRLKNSPLLFHLVDEDFAISNLGSDPNIDALKSKIFEIAQKQVYWGEEIPARWISLERALMELKNRGIPTFVNSFKDILDCIIVVYQDIQDYWNSFGTFYIFGLKIGTFRIIWNLIHNIVIDYADVKSVNETREVRIETPEELDLFLRFEHDMGNIVFFNTERLRKKVVLDPEWLIHGVRIWITSDQVIKRHPELTEQWFAFKNTGRLTSTLIEKLWSPHSKIHQHKEHLLDVMEKLNIIAKPLQREEEDYYWVPCMVSMHAPDDVKKRQQNKDTIKTSTLCFRLKTDFIHVGVFHRLLATCLSKWPPAKEENKYLLFQGLCVFDLNNQHQLLLSLNDFVIHVTVIRFTKKNRIPDHPLCMKIWDCLYSALSEISDCLCPGSELEICIKCKESSPLTNEGLHSVSTLRTEDELKCSTHKEAHCVESGELLGFWEEDTKRIPVDVKPQHLTRHSERFTRLISLVLDVGTKILQKVLTYCATTPLSTLDQYMKNNEPDIRELQKRKVLTQAEVDIIFPQSGQTDIKKYDITLASALLNNIYPSLGQQEKQIITDLRTERNELVHSPSTKMSEHEFQAKWTRVNKILTSLSKLCKDPNFDNEIQKEIQDIQQSGSGAIVSKMPEMREKFNKVRKILEEMETDMDVL